MAKTIRKKAKILLLTPEEASGQEVELSALRRNSDVYIEELWLTDDQREKLEAIYAFSGHPELCNRQFSVRKPEEQVEAAALLASEGLDPDGRASIGNRWTSRWWMDSEKKGIVTRRELYQWCVSSLLVRQQTYSYRANPVTAGTTTMYASPGPGAWR